jgi:hypothetical protein
MFRGTLPIFSAKTNFYPVKEALSLTSRFFLQSVQIQFPTIVFSNCIAKNAILYYGAGILSAFIS